MHLEAGNTSLPCWHQNASCASCVQTLADHPENINIIFGEGERTLLGASAIFFAIAGTVANSVLLASLLLVQR